MQGRLARCTFTQIPLVRRRTIPGARLAFHVVITSSTASIMSYLFSSRIRAKGIRERPLCGFGGVGRRVDARLRWCCGERHRASEVRSRHIALQPALLGDRALSLRLTISEGVNRAGALSIQLRASKQLIMSWVRGSRRLLSLDCGLRQDG